MSRPEVECVSGKSKGPKKCSNPYLISSGLRFFVGRPATWPLPDIDDIWLFIMPRKSVAGMGDEVR
jgi:hypothetical protein